MKGADNISVMIVDDDPAVLESCADLLDKYGYSVIPCPNAKDALDKLETTHTDVVLSDIRMPFISGVELLEEVHKRNAEIPVILMTGYADLSIAIEAMNKGAFDFIVKPYKAELLVKAIAVAVKHKRYKH